LTREFGKIFQAETRRLKKSFLNDVLMLDDLKKNGMVDAVENTEIEKWDSDEITIKGQYDAT